MGHLFFEGLAGRAYLTEAVEISPLLKMYSEYEPASSEKKVVRTAKIPNPRFFGRTDLWISLSRAKFHEEADFEVRSAVTPQRRSQINAKSEILLKIFFRR